MSGSIIILEGKLHLMTRNAYSSLVHMNRAPWTWGWVADPPGWKLQRKLSGESTDGTLPRMLLFQWNSWVFLLQKFSYSNSPSWTGVSAYAFACKDDFRCWWGVLCGQLGCPIFITWPWASPWDCQWTQGLRDVYLWSWLLSYCNFTGAL